jgi:hypothetical protein
MLSNEPFYRVALGGYRVLVPAHQASLARELLDTVRQDMGKAGYMFDGVACSQCGGARFRREKTLLLGAMLTLLAGTPFARNTGRLRCVNCGAMTKAPEEAENE